MGDPPSRATVFIVDDDASVLRALGRMVSSFGYDVQLFGSGRECLDDPHLEMADCLILDVMMSGIDGFELYTLLKSSGRSVPAVFISAHDDPRHRKQAESIGAVTYLLKPCEESHLHDAINVAMASADGPDPESLRP